MARTRALITETERARIAGEEDVEEIKRYQAISRVRRRIEEELVKDMAILREHHEGLSELAQEVVCAESKGESIATSGISEPEPGRSEPREPAVANGDETTDVDLEQLRDALAGSGELLERRVEAIETMYGYVRSNGEASKRELLALVDPDEVGYDSYESVWSNMVKGKDTLSALPGVETPPTGRSTWTHTE